MEYLSPQLVCKKTYKKDYYYLTQEIKCKDKTQYIQSYPESFPHWYQKGSNSKVSKTEKEFTQAYGYKGIIFIYNEKNRVYKQLYYSKGLSR